MLWRWKSQNIRIQLSHQTSHHSILYGKSDDPLAQLHAELEELNSIKPLPEVSNFHLRDIEGRPVEANTDYDLELYDEDHDILNAFEDQLRATYYLNAHNENEVVVRYSIVDGVHYLTWKNKYMHAAGDGRHGIQLSDQLSRKHQRLQFQVTENNTFIMVQWNQRNCLLLELLTCSYSQIYFLPNYLSKSDVS